ncbi:lipid asymmetry maintenance protein MlaB [Roseateles sp. DXS20W]|uniref:Lipid asymmetry maintenance protein MlaB n=1 Tax=Pelomonas lactea TaxID=3299030 RepID=A0ABW7GPZ5_9BURK
MDLLLPAELSIYTAAELHPQWLAWAAQHTGHEATADATAVDQVDGAGVQLLVALERGLAARGVALRLRNPSRPLREACTALGLAGWLAHAAPQPTPEAA